MNAPTGSPLDPIFHPTAAPVPRAFREQFLYRDTLPYRVRLEGVLHRVWHRPPVLMPLFRALGWAGILVPYAGRDLPTTLEVIASRDPAGRPVHRWSRTIRFPNKKIRFDTSIIYDAQRGTVVDLVGPQQVLYLVWAARFRPPDTFTLDSCANAIRIGRWKLWLPRWAWKPLLGTVAFTQRVDPADGNVVHIDLLITHPLFGPIFGYDGTFRAERVAQPPDVIAEGKPSARD
ncbi:MAG TPA: DUF4166 domain-containing protein [Tepidisphaeraceae bacterium]|nr:DUF4166 domain-containing protein [Tepidisphaeraceae bacterium]